MNFKKSIVAAALASIITACGEKSSEEHLNNAQTLINNNDFKAAIIELKNATKADDSNFTTRELLADIYLKTGQIDFAEKEYLRALEYGASPSSVFPKYAEALFFKTDYQQITELELTDDEKSDGNIDKLFFIQALSASNLRDTKAAITFYEQAIEANPDSVYGKLSSALVLVDQSPEKSLSSISNIMESHKDFALGYLVKGHFENQLQHFEASLASYEKFSELTPDLLLADMYVALSFAQNAKYEQAVNVAKKITQKIKNQPLANQILATSYFNLKDFEQSLLFSEVALINGLDSTQNRVIAGLSAYSLNKLELAYSHFSKVKAKLPKDHFARQAILATEIRIGKIEELETSIEELDSSLLQPELINAASLELFKAGKTDAGKSLIAKSDSLEYSDPTNLSRLGVLKISTSDMSGIQDLEKAVQLDSSSVPLHITLGSAYVQAKEFDKATLFAKEFIAKFPKSIESYNYAALVAYQTDNQSDLESYLSSALTIDPYNKMSLMFNANRHFKNEEFQLAYNLSKKVLSKEPGYIPAIEMAVTTAQKLDKEDELSDIFAAGLTTINKVDIALVKAKYHYANQDYKAVLETLLLNDADSTTPAEFWSLLTRSTFSLEGTNSSINVLKKWVEVQPENMNSWTSLISFLEKSQRSSEAYKVTKNAYQKFSNSAEISLMYAYYLSLDNKTELASAILNNIEVTKDNRSLYTLTQAQVALHLGKYQHALDLVNKSYGFSPTFNAVRIKYALVKSLNGQADALEFIEEHLAQYSFDNPTRLMAANEYLSTDPLKAIKHYESVLELLPNNITALNNAAYLLSNEKKFERAILHAKRAVELNKNNPNTLDTLGMIYYKQGDLNKAHKTLKAAYNLAPTNQTVVKHLKQVEAAL